MKKSGRKIVCENRKARHDYFLEDFYEAGISLTGTEVKSLREGKANLRDSYCEFRGKSVYLINMHISPYSKASIRDNHEPQRPRRLLLHKYEILKLLNRVKEKGYTLIPVTIYFNDRGYAKAEIALAKGKRQYDKRDDILERDAKRRIERALKEKFR